MKTNWEEIVKRCAGEAKEWDRKVGTNRGSIAKSLSTLALAEAEKMVGREKSQIPYKWQCPNCQPRIPGGKVDVTFKDGEPICTACGQVVQQLEDPPKPEQPKTMTEASLDAKVDEWNSLPHEERLRIRALCDPTPTNTCTDCATDERPEDWPVMKMYNEQRWRICDVCERVQVNISGVVDRWDWLDECTISFTTKGTVSVPSASPVECGHEWAHHAISASDTEIKCRKCGTRKDGENE